MLIDQSFGRGRYIRHSLRDAQRTRLDGADRTTVHLHTSVFAGRFGR